MRILIDAHCFDHQGTEGIDTYIKGIYTRLPALAPEAEFFFAARDTARLRSIFGDAPNTGFISLKATTRPRRILSEFPRIIRHIGADAAHFQYFAPPVLKCRTIVTLHDILFKDFPQFFPTSYRLSRDPAFRHSSRRADILTTVSSYSRDRISSHYGISPDSIEVIPNAVADDFFDIDVDAARSFAGSRGVRPYILNVSRIEPRKNQLALLQAYTGLNLAQRGYDLVLINQPALPVAEFDRYLASIPGETRRHIHTPVAVSHDELRMWYAAASLFVYPSMAEGFGIPPIEAGAARIPVICNDSTAMSDFAFFGPNLADLSRPGILERLMERNLAAPPSADELKNISDTIRTRYSWQESAERLLAIMKKIL
ncbi:MAG: glycosyltransferase family 4 protein [Muribaculaceae bacterium]|nr:glycosyltransferase family 4 protein [Muribaculaceae bacterium]